MNKKKSANKYQSGLSIHEIEQFTRQHVTEVFTILALATGAIASAFDFFTGPKMTITIAAIGAIWGIVSPKNIELLLKQVAQFTYRQDNNTQMVLGVVKLVIAIFIPFVLFGLVGMMAGASYHYYLRQAQGIDSNKSPKTPPPTSGEEHD